MGAPDFAVLYAEHLAAARRVAMAVAPAHAADDIVAEAFTRVLAAARAGGGPSAATFRPYLLAAVRNLARDWTASQRREVPVSCPEYRTAVPGAGELAGRREELRMVSRAFGSLPPRWRAVLWQTEVEGKTPGELARASGMSANAVARLAFRARNGLAEAWQRERGMQERVTGPLPRLAALDARRKQKRIS